MDNLIYLGYISGTFGLKGELKLITDSNLLDKILNVGSELIIDDKSYKLSNYHFHNNHHIITFDGYEDINKCDDFLKKDVYINLDNLNLKDDEVLYSEMIGYEIIDNNKKIGVVEDILLSKKTTFVKYGNLIIPFEDKYFIKASRMDKKIYVQNSEELML